MHQYHRAKWGLVLFFLIAFSKTGAAQGSPYDVIGFGLPVQSGNAVIDALGGTGVAMDASRFANDLNPADWTWVTRTRFGASVHYDLDNASQNGITDRQQNIQFSGAAFVAPVWNRVHGAISLGYVPLTNASDDINENTSESTDNYIVRGGTNLVYAGFAARPSSAIALGARLDLVTGDIRHIGQVTFNDTNAGTSQFEQDYLYYGVRPTFGLELIGDSISDALNGITIGAAYSFATKLNSSEQQIITPLASTLDTTTETNGVGHYPASLSAGISFHLNGRYRVEADYFAQDFSTAYLYSPTAISGDSLLRASNRFSVGIERLANFNSEFGSATGFDRWALRLGFSYGMLPVNPTGSGGIREYSVSGGLGIPVSLETVLNLALVVGQRAPLNSGTAPNETFVRLGADISFSEQWFVPTRRQ